jgi:type I restriction enzyme S subunit
MKKGWQTKTIGDLCEFHRGLTYAKGDEVDVSHNVVLRATNIDLATNLLIFDELKYISDKVVVPESKKVKKGSLMICMASGSKSHLGKVAFIDDDYGYAFGGFMGMLTPMNGLLPKYLFHLMTSEDYKDFIGALSDGANINNLTFDKLKRFPVPVPPLAEQQRIVGLLDEAFAGIATARANAEKNLQNSRALFESHLQAVFTQRGPGWVEKRLADVADFKNGLNFTRQSNGQTLRMVGVGDFQKHSVVPIETLQSVTIDGKLSDDYLIRRDDILTVRSNGSKDLVGRCMLVPNVDETTSFSGFIIRIRFDTRVVSPRFLLHFLKSSATRDRLTSDGGGTNISNINQAKLSELPVSLPSFKQQEKIADRLDDLREETQRLATLYERKLAALEALKKSLLHQAFNGELTAHARDSVVIPFPSRIPNITTTDLHAGILGIAYQLHEQKGKQSYFGHVKAEKVSHMVEAHLGIDLGRNAVKDAAGPDDYSHLVRVEHRAKNAGFFLFRRTAGSGYKLTKYRRFDSLINKTRLALGDRNAEVDALLRLMLPMDKEQSEILATVYAAWNNLLIERKPVTDDAIVLEARENWHPDKLNIKRDRFFRAIKWMNKQGVVPTGKGKKVVSSVKKKNAKRSRNQSRTH